MAYFRQQKIIYSHLEKVLVSDDQSNTGTFYYLFSSAIKPTDYRTSYVTETLSVTFCWP